MATSKRKVSTKISKSAAKKLNSSLDNQQVVAMVLERLDKFTREELDTLSDALDAEIWDDIIEVPDNDDIDFDLDNLS